MAKMKNYKVKLEYVLLISAESGISIIAMFSAILRINPDFPVAKGEGSESALLNPPPNPNIPKSLATFSHALDRNGMRQWWGTSQPSGQVQETGRKCIIPAMDLASQDLSGQPVFWKASLIKTYFGCEICSIMTF